METDLTDVEVNLILSMIEKTPAMGLEAIRTLLLLACKLQGLQEPEDKEE